MRQPRSAPAATVPSTPIWKEIEMPEVRLQLQWPDGGTSEFYSPSTVVLDYLQPGDALSISKLEQVGVKALREASEQIGRAHV